MHKITEARLKWMAPNEALCWLVWSPWSSWNFWRLQRSTSRDSHCEVSGWFVLLVKEEMMLQGVTDRLTEIVQCYGKEMNVEKANGMTIWRQPSAAQIMTGQNNREMWSFFSNIWVNARCRREIMSRFAVANAAFDKRRILSADNCI